MKTLSRKSLSNSALAACFFMLLSANLKAGVEPTLSQKKQGPSQLTVNAEVVVEDEKYSCLSTSSCSPSFTTTKLENAVVLGIDQDYESCVDSFGITFSLELKYYLLSAPTTLVTKNISLSLAYDPKLNRLTEDKSIYRLENAVKLTTKILSVSSSLGSNAVPGNVYIENLLAKERYYAFSCSSTPSSLTIDTAENGFFSISWNSVSGAEEYDLEWIYVDDFEDDAGSSNTYYTASELEYSFINDASRVTVKGTSFQLRNLYEHGYILFRVRAVGAGGTDFKQPLPGAWTSDAYSGNLVSDFTARYFNENGHESLLNWQWNNTFAEEGKYKSVISYADGTLRSRQVVTAMNSDQLAVVGESVYDHVGRKAVDILPAPAGENRIKFYPDFNLSDQSGDPYNWTDFDTVNSFLTCANTIRPMSTAAGASRYYSPSNPDQDLYQAYVPDAQKYPFALTEFMPDNTGRVRRQSGVGPDHTLGSGHETQYYYSTPSQWELDRLFGNEAGDANRYKKNMVVDANGTVSVSYINARGAVVATALAGEAPSNLQTLDTTGARDTAVIDMTKKTIVDQFAQKIIAYHSLMLSSSSLVTIDYKMRDLVYERDGCGLDAICFDCAYDLKIYVMGECGDTLHKLVQYNIHPFDTLCSSDSFTHSKVLALQRGTYSIYKELSVNQDALDRYVDLFIERNSCIRPLDSIYADMLEQTDFTGCYNSCDSCLSKLGTLSAYISSQATKYGLNPAADSVISLFTEEYNDQYEDCRLLCNSYSPCEVEKNLLMQDVSPGGQYFLYELSGSSYVSSDVLSFAAEEPGNNHTDYKGATRNWKNPAIVYHDQNGEESLIWYGGEWVSPNELPLDTFLANWKSSWAEDLIVMHPEYCYYKWCLENDTSNYEDAVFSNVETFADAQSDSLLNTVGADLLSYPEKRDNYFKPGKYGYPQLSAMQARMASYSTLYGNTYNIYEAAAIMAACPYAASAADISACLAANPFGSGTDGIKDKQWQYYKNLYLGVKAEFMDTRRNQYAADSACKNCYIASNGYLNPDSCAGGDNEFRNKERLFKSMLAATRLNLSLSPESNMANGKALADSALRTHCQEQCELYADRWMLELDSCDLDSADSVAVRAGLIEVCRKGCDYNNGFGASAISHDSAGGNRSFGDVLEDVLGPGYRTKVCNEDMISWPLGYDHSYTQADWVPADSCFMADFVSILDELYGCDVSDELFALKDMLTSLNDSGLLNTNDAEEALNMYTLSPEAWDGYTESLRPHIYIGSGQSDVYHSGIEDVSTSQVALDGWFVSVTDTLRDSCKFRLYAPPGHPASIFDSIASFGTVTFEPDSFDLFCNRNYTSSSFRINVTLLNASSYTLKGSSNCLTMCDDKGKLSAQVIAGEYLERYCVDLDTGTIHELMDYLCDSTYRPAVPRELSCKPRCITCDRYFSARTRFSTRYSGIYTLTDSSWKQNGFTTAFTNFMNSELGMNLGFDDFNDFDDICDSLYKTSLAQPGDLPPISNPYTYSRYLKVKNGCDTTLPTAVEDTLLNRLSLCDKTVDEILEPDPNPCVTELKASAYYNAQRRYNFIIDSLKADFRQRYAANCLSMIDKELFTVTHDVKEYHFTLYYYDQAGNLVKTVPPNGVSIITSPHSFAKIDAYRANPGGTGTSFTVPEHSYVTNYKYTTLEQVYEQISPDGRTVNFFYDYLGRLVVSQNMEQARDTTYSYTKYDDLGRITEVGELKASALLTFNNAKGQSSFNSWFNGSTSAYSQITKTVYEDKAGNSVQAKLGGKGQENLRNRVSSISYDDDGNSLPEYENFYTYDIHGNVKTLLQYYDAFTQVNGGYFRADYDYDLISGNVNKVSYQEGSQDQFFHKYQYDADNRLTHAYTSRDNFTWDNDAQYFYYQHGPLARAEIGQLKVQGIDYAYTIHGWLKGVNSASLDTSRDIGADGWDHMSNIHRYMPKDLFGFTLGYYQGDYHDIGELGAGEHFEIACTGSQGIDAASPSLFNGNIRHMVTAIGKFMEGHAGNASKPLATAYKYDQLNRLLSMWVYDSINMSSNSWYSTANALPQYHNRFTYDGNGNILTQVRRGSLASGLALDSLNYNYSDGRNYLRNVKDGVSSSAYSDDLDNQTQNSNYDYDLAGNLIADISGKIDLITWNVYGKIRSIISASNSTRPRIDFTYGPGGHRLSKTTTKGDTINTEYYVRDAQGNILATYALTNAFYHTLDTSYQRVIERLVDSLGITSFAGFMKARFASNSTFYTSLGAYKPNSAMITSLVDNGVNTCIGNRIYGELFGCCDNCAETHNRDLFNELVNDANSQSANLVQQLLSCNPELVLEGLLKTYDSIFLHRFWADSGLSVMYNYFKTRYQPVHPTYISYLKNDVPVAEVAWYFAYKLGNYYSLSNSGMNSRILLELSTNMMLTTGAMNEVMRKHYPPCKFLECMRTCFASETSDVNLGSGAYCMNGSVSSLSSRYSSYINAWTSEPNYSSTRTSIASHTWTNSEFNTVTNCDPSAFLLAALKYNATSIINDYAANYGSLSGIVTWFLGKYPYPNPASPLSNTAYLSTVVPKEELAWYLVYVQGQPLPGGFTTWLNGRFTALYSNSDVQTILGTHYADCDIKKCIISNGIIGSLGTTVPLASWLASNKAQFMLSAGDLCLPNSYTGLINRSTAYLMAGKAVRCSENLRRDMLNKYPYYSLMIQGLEDDHNDMVATLKTCNYEGFFKALLHTAGREFLSEINTLSSTTISNAVSNFNGTYIPNPMVDNVDYLLKQVPVNELAAWFNSQAYNYSTAAGSLANDVIARALTARFQDCDFRTCLTEEWIDTNITIKFDSLIDWYKENYWTNILAETYSCSADSFTYFTSYNQRTIIAEILDDWHLPMKDFMTEIQTHYGSGIKNWLNLDTLRQYQYAKLNELHIYGSSRLGTMAVNDTVHGGIRLYNFDLSTGDTSLTYDMAYEDFYTFDSAYKLYRGDKSYEGSNHLGNVLVVFTDKRIPLCSAGTVYKYQADLKQAQHYSAFGAPLADLRWYALSSQYKFGQNTQEQDDEIAGDGNIYTAEFWEYDARLGRRWNIDPMSEPWLSPYSCFTNSPICMVDILGLSPEEPNKPQIRHSTNSEGNIIQEVSFDNGKTWEERYAGNDIEEVIVKTQAKEPKAAKEQHYSDIFRSGGYVAIDYDDNGFRQYGVKGIFSHTMIVDVVVTPEYVYKQVDNKTVKEFTGYNLIRVSATSFGSLKTVGTLIGSVSAELILGDQKKGFELTLQQPKGSYISRGGPITRYEGEATFRVQADQYMGPAVLELNARWGVEWQDHTQSFPTDITGLYPVSNKATINLNITP